MCPHSQSAQTACQGRCQRTVIVWPQSLQGAFSTGVIAIRFCSGYRYRVRLPFSHRAHVVIERGFRCLRGTGQAGVRWVTVGRSSEGFPPPMHRTGVRPDGARESVRSPLSRRLRLAWVAIHWLWVVLSSVSGGTREVARRWLAGHCMCPIPIGFLANLASRVCPPAWRH